MPYSIIPITRTPDNSNSRQLELKLNPLALILLHNLPRITRTFVNSNHFHRSLGGSSYREYTVFAKKHNIYGKPRKNTNHFYTSKHVSTELGLRLVYTDYHSSCDQLLAQDGSFRIRHRNLQRLAIEMYKFNNNLGPEILNDANSSNYNTRSDTICF